MSNTRRRPYVTPKVLALWLAGGIVGCGAIAPQPRPQPAEPQAAFTDGNVDPQAVSNRGPTQGEPNDSFARALAAVLSAADVARLQGTIETIGDLDVFDLGPLDSGDRVIVDVDTMGGPLDVSIALFDAAERLFIDNDDRETEPRVLDSYVDETVRHDSAAYYLVVGASAFAASFEAGVGSYRATVTVRRGQTAPQPAGQALVLDFDGGQVAAPSIPVSVVAPFDAADISPRYAGETGLIQSTIVETVRENFAGLDVEVTTSDDPTPIGPFSTVFFGGRNPVAFGISESIDHYNRDPDDVVVIFTESFAPDAFTLAPDATALGLAIGNIASHEAGHILGLNHVNDPTALMDAVSPADAFLADQDFKQAPLSEQILPIGYQDALLLLAEIVGLR